MRITKKKYTGQTTSYYYAGNKLITEISSSCRLDFLYDENGQLYGLVKDNKDKYFYVKDCLGTILGIVNENGSLVTKYSYTGYGKCTITYNGNGISSLNPFRFKGYYYDQESGMYYCHTRYYVSEWGRWLNADDPAYLDFGNPTCANLFAYCENEPITKLDVCGTDWTLIWSQIEQDWNFRWNRFVNNIRSFGWKLLDTAQVIIDSFVLEFGVGGGFGVEGKIGPFDVGLLAKTDVFSFKGDCETLTNPFGMRQVAKIGVSLGALDGDLLFRDYYESYDGKIVQDNSNQHSWFVGVGASAYLGIGASFSIGVDIGKWKEINGIWGY